VDVSAITPDPGLDRRIRRLMAFRVVMITTLLATAVYVETVSETPATSTPLYGLIGATYLLNGAYALALRLTPRRLPLVFGQVVGDLLIVTGLVYLTGDNRGGFLLLYPLAVLAGSVLVARSESLWLSLLAVVMYAGLLVVVRFGWVSAAGLGTVPWVSLRGLAYSVFVTGVACVTVALVGSYFSQSLRIADERLDRAAEAMEDLQELNRLVVESIQSGLMMVDEVGRILHVNGVGERILGLGVSAIRGRRVSDVLSAGELEPSVLSVRAADRGLSRLELTYVRSDGARLDIGLSLSPLARTKSKELPGFLIAFQDLTEMKSLEREMRTREKLAAVGEMAALLAHEIRNPLGSISGSAQMLLSEPRLSVEQERLLSIIKRESLRLSDSLNQFLLQTRPDARSRGPVDIGRVLGQAVALLENSAEVRSRHSVEYVCESDGILCVADPDAITQVFWNLARNGIEAMPNGGKLLIRLARDGRDAILQFRDDGRGMGEEEQRRIFEPFESRTPMGTGLGLAIVYRIVREHRGDILVKSAPGSGTEVEVRLPLITTPARSAGA
jgi:two-component system, NtrC family, sensor histidine kinase PilS